MLLHFFAPALLVFITVILHAVFTARLLGWIGSLPPDHRARQHRLGRAVVLSGVVFLMSLVAYLEAGLWAVFYLLVGAISEANEAMYFSLVTFTTLGYGDVTLSPEWRVLGAFEAANGIIMFGWTTALIVFVVQHLFAHDPQGPSRT